MTNKLLEFAESLGLGIDWSTSQNSVYAKLKNSNDFSRALSKLSALSSLDELSSDISITGSSFSWNAYEDNMEVPSYYIEAEGDFDLDDYEVTVWQKL